MNSSLRTVVILRPRAAQSRPLSMEDSLYPQGGDLKTLALLPEARECLLLVAKW